VSFTLVSLASVSLALVSLPADVRVEPLEVRLPGYLIRPSVIHVALGEPLRDIDGGGRAGLAAVVRLRDRLDLRL